MESSEQKLVEIKPLPEENKAESPKEPVIPPKKSKRKNK